MESTTYEEDQQQNLFMTGLQKRPKLVKLFDAAFSAGNAVQCVPKQSSLPSSKVFLEESFLTDHQLMPYHLDLGHFSGEQTTYTNGVYFIHVSTSHGNSFSVYNEFPTAPVTRAYTNLEQYFDTTLPAPVLVVKVQFEETYYNDAFQSIKQQCLDAPIRVNSNQSALSPLMPKASGQFELQNSSIQQSQYGSSAIVSMQQPDAKNLAVNRVPQQSPQHLGLLTTNYLNTPLRLSAQHPHVLTTHISSLPDQALVLEAAYQSSNHSDVINSTQFHPLVEARTVEEHKEFLKYILGAKEAKQVVFKHPNQLYFISEYTISLQACADKDKTAELALDLQKISGILFDECMFSLSNNTAGRSKNVAHAVLKSITLQREVHLAIYCYIAHLVQEDVFHWLVAECHEQWSTITSNIEYYRRLRVSDMGLATDLVDVLETSLPVGFSPPALLLSPDSTDIALQYEFIRRQAVAALVAESTTQFTPFVGIPDWVPSGTNVIGEPVTVSSSTDRPEPGYYRGGQCGAEQVYSRFYYISGSNREPAVLRNLSCLGFLGGNSIDASGLYVVNDHRELIGNKSLLRCWRCKTLIEKRCLTCENQLGQKAGVNAKRRLDSLQKGKNSMDTPEWHAMASPSKMSFHNGDTSKGVFDSDSDDLKLHQRGLQAHQARCMPAIMLPHGSDPQQHDDADEDDTPPVSVLATVEEQTTQAQEEIKRAVSPHLEHTTHILKGPTEVSPVFTPPFGFAAIQRLCSIPSDVSSLTSLEVQSFFHEVYQLVQWDVMSRWRYSEELAKSKFGNHMRKDSNGGSIFGDVKGNRRGSNCSTIDEEPIPSFVTVDNQIVNISQTNTNEANNMSIDDSADYDFQTKREIMTISGAIRTEQPAQRSGEDATHVLEYVDMMKYDDDDEDKVITDKMQVLVINPTEAERKAEEARRKLQQQSATTPPESHIPGSLELGDIHKSSAYSNLLLNNNKDDEESDGQGDIEEEEYDANISDLFVSPLSTTNTALPQPQRPGNTPRSSVSQGTASLPKDNKLYITADDMLPLLCYVIIHACDQFQATRVHLVQSEAQSYAHIHAELTSDPYAQCSGATTAASHAQQIECPTMHLEARPLPPQDPPFLTLLLAFASYFQPPSGCTPSRMSAAQQSVAHFSGALSQLSQKDGKFLSLAKLRSSQSLMQRMEETEQDVTAPVDPFPSHLQEGQFDMSDLFNDTLEDTNSPAGFLRAPTKDQELDGLFDDDVRGAPEVVDVQDVPIGAGRRRRHVSSALDTMLPASYMKTCTDTPMPNVLKVRNTPELQVGSPSVNRELSVLQSDEMDPLGLHRNHK